jgi:hypothetical protein
MDTFGICKAINAYLLEGNEIKARNEIIKLLDKKNEIEPCYYQLTTHLIRETGLYTYLDIFDNKSSSWNDRYIYEIFKSDCGYDELITLHREQSYLLKQLLNGQDIVVSAPTSFGKSFIIDAFIAIKKPKNVVIVVPTIALTDETRRRLYKKFSDRYKIITTSSSDLAGRNILIFPQERALNYLGALESIDILIIDEFYKVSANFGDERIPSLYKAIVELSKISKQKYFLAPNIKGINDNYLTNGMEFINKLDFNTVVLETHEIFHNITDIQEKNQELINILNMCYQDGNIEKTLIYAGTHSAIDEISILLVDKLPIQDNILLKEFSLWLKTNYSTAWYLPSLVERGIGIHNGNMHRSLSQLQIKFFEEENGLNAVISTSSIIEGVNTSARNVVVWKNKIGRKPLNDFTYKNIVGRGGRMFKYFVGKVYLLEKPPLDDSNQIKIEFPEELLGSYEENDLPEQLSADQKAKNDDIRKEIISRIGKDNYSTIFKGGLLQTVDNQLALKIIISLKNDDDWNGFEYFLSDNPQVWDRLLYKIILLSSDWQSKYTNIVEFVKVLYHNWNETIPEMLDELDDLQISINEFFKLEKIVSFKLAALLNDVNVLYRVCRNKQTDISPFVSKLSYAFLPKLVYQLEEFGLPRMLSRKMVENGILDLENNTLDIYDIIEKFKTFGFELIIKRLNPNDIEKYILEYFFDGIMINKRKPEKTKSPSGGYK